MVVKYFRNSLVQVADHISVIIVGVVIVVAGTAVGKPSGAASTYRIGHFQQTVGVLVAVLVGISQVIHAYLILTGITRMPEQAQDVPVSVIGKLFIISPGKEARAYYAHFCKM